jgi:hypothetical protein
MGEVKSFSIPELALLNVVVTQCDVSGTATTPKIGFSLERYPRHYGGKFTGLALNL